MGERTAALADQYEDAVRNLVGLVRQCSDEQWQAQCPDEGWTVAVTAHHVSDWWPVIAPMVQAIGAGAPVTAPSLPEVHHKNADHAERYGACTRTETIDVLIEGS